ncbi:MAG: hypothetical protein H0X24_18840 [Ktedonobacterales bacterium]|nr:hypothetical protein [Ktedonobacterales bacterium]
MTTFGSRNVTCAVCQTLSEQSYLRSTNTMGPPDLDTRPAPMERDTLGFVIARCPTCGYCAPDLTEAPAEARDVVATDGYRAQLHQDAFPELANTYLCWALICEVTRDYHRAGWAALSAAWVCDDAASKSVALVELAIPVALSGEASALAARVSRRRAISLFLTAREYEQVFMEGLGGEELLLTDLYRRCGEFALAEQMARRGIAKSSEAVIISILRGQLALIKRADTAAHTIPEAIARADERE